ncbi:MAG: antitoxin VapB family protein [Candidatus Diapherotrites archaeon]|uniref:Antitoxin VapB family protein n=1 Tax=Candidatus Iainarchaeum sp. TaxID=3101447 RepID=A0A8T3YPV8_9ARCH|nr:antitoxin VapB family protein [Candidatus Diapherotrites archaeon]
MASQNISVKQEAYDFLRSRKGRDRSFSDVILEFKEMGADKKGSPEAVMKFFGVLKGKGIDWKEKEKRMAEFRAEVERRLA